MGETVDVLSAEAARRRPTPSVTGLVMLEDETSPVLDDASVGK
jgi:hypothetical protein